MQCGPLFECVDSYRVHLQAERYKPGTITAHLQIVARFDGWLKHRGYRVRDVNEDLAARFLATVRRKMPYRLGVPAALRRLLDHLRKIGTILPRSDTDRLCPVQIRLEEYRNHLLQDQGLAESTVHRYLGYVGPFLNDRYGDAPVELRSVSAADIIAFIRHEVRRIGRCHAKHVIVALRSFLRFARYRGYIETDLTPALPRVAQWAMDGLPKHLPTGAVRQVLKHCDRRTAIGKRDYAVLLLLARLGLRGGEVFALKLEDIDWENGRIEIYCKKSDRPAQLPIPGDVGCAIARYLKAGRPRCSCRQVFIRSRAPYQPLAGSAVISGLVMRAIEKARVKTACKGAHVFRHTLATEMLNRGASLGEIGQILRHRHPDTTAIYAKVHVRALRELALPWPGGVR